MNEIRKFIDNISPLNNSDWNFFSSKLKKVKFDKNTTVLESGKIETKLSFISKGIIRLYIPKEETDLTFGFLFENEFVTAYDSLLTQSPSEYQIETLTETILWQISNKDLQEVYKRTNNGNIIGRKMAENMYLIKSKRELSLLSKTAEERYLDLFFDSPKLLQQIPLKYIASYIGVTPQALSRIRKRIT
ncbi:Crp/Fnr family transcriptional regulator [Polaribacter vadi]|uniref:Crp/Fnr family transcriptional regulator n=1 Tax=Polaribacter TaxID=52959 RepID=UPI001C0A1B0F|nr:MULTISPECIES: Crp/Fnr family transcriptional regulator [Polaribacter]MBU3012325.1 Crp/Fnr family transcriptional regulator [Polaribacter vadi]MDO6742142.1 Crp/Fnr family transcriptional regulator [Polaribacter sp. 1_MG-2023]